MGRTAVVIGAGIGGLAAARALRRTGWAVTVLERNKALPTSGTMLGMWPAAMKALDEIGAGEAVRRTATRVDNLDGPTGLWTPSGRTLVTTSGGADMRLISRPELVAALADGVSITFETQGEDEAYQREVDVVVGADGTFSRTRAAMFGDRFAARSLGAVAWRGTVPGTMRGYGETWGPGAMFGITPTGRDSTNWYACVRGNGPLAGPPLSHLWQRFGSWHGGVTEVLRRINGDEILHHELFETPKLPTYFSPNTALVGDAAHSMGPFLGRGACEALVDAATLGRALDGTTAVEEGLANYDRARRAPTERLVWGSWLMGRLAMMSTGMKARNAMLGAVGSVMERRERWAWGSASVPWP